MLNSTPVAKIFDVIYPVGSIYMSTTLTTKEQVEAIFGGTWEKLEGRFLLGSSSFYVNGATGGEASHTLTINEMPSHSHEYYRMKSGGSTWWVQGEEGTIFSQEYIDTNSNGSGYAHNNMPPYLVVNMFKRTA